MKKILLIDDNKDFVEMLSTYLKDEGYDVKCLTDPEKTEEYIESFTPSLLIIDILMPIRSGFNIIEDFQEKGLYENIPKIFLTGLDDDVEKMTARGIGVCEYITKPVMPTELKRVIDNVLDRSPGTPV
jgi:DNA-binding response OmpR family regulator